MTLKGKKEKKGIKQDPFHREVVSQIQKEVYAGYSDELKARIAEARARGRAKVKAQAEKRRAIRAETRRLYGLSKPSHYHPSGGADLAILRELANKLLNDFGLQCDQNQDLDYYYEIIKGLRPDYAKIKQQLGIKNKK